MLRIDGNRSFSFGAIFLTRESNTRTHPEDVVRHEYGHLLQMKLIDPITYFVNIGIPSMADLGDGDYEDKLWAVSAEVLGDVKSGTHSKEKIIAGFAYLGFSMLFGPVGYTVWPLTYHRKEVE